MNNEMNKYLISPNISVKEAMKRLDKARSKVLFIINSENKLIGSISDGDIRRWLLSGGNLESLVKNVYNHHPFTIFEGYNIDLLKEEILKKNFSAVPLLDSDKKVKKIFFFEELFGKEKIKSKKRKLNCDTVIMAGGKGTRLQPFTKVLPKPLIPIGNKTIIEIIIDKFLNYSIDFFYISINYKSKIIKSYFEELDHSYSIEFIEEVKPLGTIGALSLIKKEVKNPIILTNCDIIIDIDYSELIDFHTENNFDISLVASVVNQKIPYGICEIKNGGELAKFSEKPEFSFLASTGMYIINPDVIKFIPKNTFFHITYLIEKVKSKGGRIGVYPINENSWFDTGEWQEYKKALEEFRL